MSTTSHANLLRLVEHYFWGNGSDGAISITGGSSTADGVFSYTKIYLDNSTFGPADERIGFYRVNSKIKLVNNSNLQARGSAGTAGGASRATVGGGVAGGAYSGSAWLHFQRLASGGGMGGAGGGGGAAQNGGRSGSAEQINIVYHATHNTIRSDGNYRGGVVGPGAAGISSVAPLFFADCDHMMRHEQFGAPGSGGGGGGIDDVGTGAPPASGAGGAGGKAGGCLILQCPYIEVEAGSSINVDGENGVAGGNAVDSGGADSDCGGGGGGGGGGAGALYILCLDIDNPANCTVTGGTGAAGGNPVGAGGAGGAGGDGGDGILALNEIGLL